MNKWDKRFMELTQQVATWSSCYKANRQVGAIIVKNKRILTTGYNGAPEGVQSCKDRGECLREKLGIPSGTRHEICYAVHAEQNAIIQAARLGIVLEGATLYCTHQPCVICAKMIINAGIKRIVYREGYPDDFAMELLNESGVSVELYQEPSAEKARPQNYHIALREDGKWQVKLGKGSKALKLFNTQAEAIAFAKEKAKNQDGSITIHKVDGKIRKQRYDKKD